MPVSHFAMSPAGCFEKKGVVVSIVVSTDILSSMIARPAEAVGGRSDRDAACQLGVGEGGRVQQLCQMCFRPTSKTGDAIGYVIGRIGFLPGAGMISTERTD
jgi:hypothetical protein